MRLSVVHFYEAMMFLQEKYDIAHGGSTISHRSKRLDAIEAVLHELVHGVCLGNPYWAAEIEGRLPLDTRDDHELTALRVELRVYDLLGHPMPVRKRRQLLKHAKFDGNHPPFERLQASLTVAEEALAALTSALIRKASILEIM
jgi:hypothetical protein